MEKEDSVPVSSFDELTECSDDDLGKVMSVSSTAKNKEDKGEISSKAQKRTTPRRAATLNKATSYSEEDTGISENSSSESNDDPDFYPFIPEDMLRHFCPEKRKPLVVNGNGQYTSPVYLASLKKNNKYLKECTSKSPASHGHDHISPPEKLVKVGDDVVSYNRKHQLHVNGSRKNVDKPMPASKKVKLLGMEFSSRKLKGNTVISDSTISSSEDVKSTFIDIKSGQKHEAAANPQNKEIRNRPKKSSNSKKFQYKLGNFLMLKEDLDMDDDPPIWQIESKLLIQKYLPFKKDGKILYRNGSMYSGWTIAAKKFFFPLLVNIVVQSDDETIVKLCGIGGEDDVDHEFENLSKKQKVKDVAVLEKDNPAKKLLDVKKEELMEDVEVLEKNHPMKELLDIKKEEVMEDVEVVEKDQPMKDDEVVTKKQPVEDTLDVKKKPTVGESSTSRRRSSSSNNKDSESNKELEVYLPDFEVYLKALISQALNSNFLMEIYAENDKYFVERITNIDKLIEEYKKRILSMIQWKNTFKLSLGKWSNIKTLSAKLSTTCHACGRRRAVRLAQLSGMPYNPVNLQRVPPSLNDPAQKEFYICEVCFTLSQLYNKVAHLKYALYNICRTIVTNMRLAEPNMPTTEVIKNVLGNDECTKQLFRSMCTNLLRVDKYSDK